MWRDILDEGVIDEYGNKIYLSATEKLLIKLKEKGERKVMALVRKNKEGEYYIEITKKEKHIFSKNNSRGFNYCMLSHLPKDMYVVIRREEMGKYYKMKVGDMLEKGSFLHFLLSGYEKQYFIPIGCFEEIKTQ